MREHPGQSTRSDPVLSMLRDHGPLSAPLIAFYLEKVGVDLSTATVRRRLVGYEKEGAAYRHPGNGTYQCPDMWEIAHG